MAFFSLESTRFKSWLVANMKIWGFLPAIAIWFVASVIVAKINPEANATLVAYCFMAAIASSVIFTMAQENQKPLVIYTLLLFCPIILLIGHAFGKFNYDFMTTGVVIYLWFDLIISLGIGGIISYYAYKNAADVFDRLFYFRKSYADILSSELSMSYMRFVEAYLYTFIGLASFAALFS